MSEPGPSPILKSAGETDLTYQLKWAAWHWLYSVAGCRAIGMEVRLEGPFGRVADLVGIGKNNIVYIVEVKSSRGDLKRDDRSETDIKRAMAQLTKRLQNSQQQSSMMRANTRWHLRKKALTGEKIRSMSHRLGIMKTSRSESLPRNAR